MGLAGITEDGGRTRGGLRRWVDLDLDRGRPGACQIRRVPPVEFDREAVLPSVLAAVIRKVRNTGPRR